MKPAITQPLCLLTVNRTPDLTNDDAAVVFDKRISFDRVATITPAGDQHHPEAGMPATVVQMACRHARRRRLPDVQLLPKCLELLTAQMCRINDQ